MKKLGILLAICMSVMCMFSLACANGGGKDCKNHAWKETSLNNGIMTYTCENCEETKTENKTALYKQTCDNIFAGLPTGANTPSSAIVNESGASAFAIEESLYINASAMDYIQVKGVMAFVKFLSVLTQNASFTYSYSPINESGTAILMYDFDEENNKVYMYWDVESTRGANTMDIFLYMDIDYNYETQELIGFTVNSYQAMGSQEMVMSYVYKDGVLRTLDSTLDLQSVKTEINVFAGQLNAKVSGLIDLQADFTTEYTAMMNIMNPAN